MLGQLQPSKPCWVTRQLSISDTRSLSALDTSLNIEAMNSRQFVSANLQNGRVGGGGQIGKKGASRQIYLLNLSLLPMAEQLWQTEKGLSVWHDPKTCKDHPIKPIVCFGMLPNQLAATPTRLPLTKRQMVSCCRRILHRHLTAGWVWKIPLEAMAQVWCMWGRGCTGGRRKHFGGLSLATTHAFQGAQMQDSVGQTFSSFCLPLGGGIITYAMLPMYLKLA